MELALYNVLVVHGDEGDGTVSITTFASAALDVMPSLRFTATEAAGPNGEPGWVINGVKTWCTFGARANVLMLLARRGHDVPDDVLHRDVTSPYDGDERVVRMLVDVYRSDDEAGLLLERLLDIDEGIDLDGVPHAGRIARALAVMRAVEWSGG